MVSPTPLYQTKDPGSFSSAGNSPTPPDLLTAFPGIPPRMGWADQMYQRSHPAVSPSIHSLPTNRLGAAAVRQSVWSQQLCLADYSVSLFYANCGLNPKFSTLTKGKPTTTAQNTAHGSSQELQDLYDELKAEIRRVQFIQEDGTYAHQVPFRNYQVGDHVWLSTKNLKTKRPSNKQDWKRIGRYEIKRAISHYAYQLKLPNIMEVYLVFYVSLLSPAATEPVPGQSISSATVGGNRQRD